MTALTIAEAKAQAKSLRLALVETGVTVSHSQALELVAQQNGARDWNTLHARLAAAAPTPLDIGARVAGIYLGQSFTGAITALAAERGGDRVTIRLDKPVDVVTFDSFSNMRSVISGVVNAEGVSLALTSDGQPQLSLQRAEK